MSVFVPYVAYIPWIIGYNFLQRVCGGAIIPGHACCLWFQPTKPLSISCSEIKRVQSEDILKNALISSPRTETAQQMVAYTSHGKDALESPDLWASPFNLNID